MSNKRVYLAKDPLASGSDVDYVRSNLLRIPDIELVEFGSHICPSTCQAFVIVPGTNADASRDEFIMLGRNIVSTAVLSFLEEMRKDRVYVYTGRDHSDEARDVEYDTPKCVYATSIYETDEDDESEYLQIDLDNCDDNLLYTVSCDIDCDDCDQWTEVPLRYSPAAAYAVPKTEPKTRSVSTGIEMSLRVSSVRRPILSRRRSR